MFHFYKVKNKIKGFEVEKLNKALKAKNKSNIKKYFDKCCHINNK